MDAQNLELIKNMLEQDFELLEVLALIGSLLGSLTVNFTLENPRTGELDKRTRAMLGTLNKIHSTPKHKVFLILFGGQTRTF